MGVVNKKNTKIFFNCCKCYNLFIYLCIFLNKPCHKSRAKNLLMKLEIRKEDLKYLKAVADDVLENLKDIYLKDAKPFFLKYVKPFFTKGFNFTPNTKEYYARKMVKENNDALRELLLQPRIGDGKKPYVVLFAITNRKYAKTTTSRNLVFCSANEVIETVHNVLLENHGFILNSLNEVDLLNDIHNEGRFFLKNQTSFKFWQLHVIDTAKFKEPEPKTNDFTVIGKA